MAQGFWYRQKSAIYFGIFLIITVSLFLYEGLKSREKTLYLVNFTLELIEKMENENNSIVKISQKMDQNNENYQVLITKINQQKLLGEKIEILWPPSDFAQNTKIFQNMGARLVEINQQNWQKKIIPELLENQKIFMDEINYSSLETNLKERSLEKVEVSLISGQKYLQNKLERTKKITNLDKQIPLVNSLEKKQETLTQINQILSQNIITKLTKTDNKSLAKIPDDKKLLDQNWLEIDQVIAQNPIKVDKSIEIKIENVRTSEFLENTEQIKKYAQNLIKI